MEELQTGVRIRPATSEDAASIADIYRPIVEETVISFEADPPSAEEFRERIRSIAQTFPWLVAEHGGNVVGYAYASPYRVRAAYAWSAEVTVYVHGDFRGKGIGRRLYERLFECLRELGYRSLFAGLTLPNAASAALHRSIGFREVGVYRNVGFKFGAWRDVLWLGLDLAEGEDWVPDAPPRRFPDWLQENVST